MNKNKKCVVCGGMVICRVVRSTTIKTNRFKYSVKHSCVLCGITQ